MKINQHPAKATVIAEKLAKVLQIYRGERNVVAAYDEFNRQPNFDNSHELLDRNERKLSILCFVRSSKTTGCVFRDLYRQHLKKQC